MTREKDDEKQMSAVLRTINILETLSECESSNLESLSKETELPKATLLRFLSSLANLGYVYRDSADRYHLTLKMFSVGSRSLKYIDLISTARPFAHELCKTLGETVHMGIPQDDYAVYVLKEESSYTLRMYSRIGKVIPLYCTAIGKIFLSEMSEEALKGYLERNTLKPYTAKSIRSEEALREELERVRKRGYSVDDEEHEEQVMCIACPIRDYENKVVAAISVSWPIFRFDRDDFENTVKQIKKTANKISEILGYQE